MKHIAGSADVTNSSGSVTITAGDTSVQIVIPVVDDAIVEWNEALLIQVVASAPTGYIVTPSYLNDDGSPYTYSIGISDNEWRWEKRSGVVIAFDHQETAGPGWINPTEFRGSLAVKATGNETDPLQGPNTLVEIASAEWWDQHLIFGGMHITREATITRSFNLDPVTGYITQATGVLGLDEEEGSAWGYDLKVAIVDGNMQILPASSTRNVVQIEVAAAAGMEGDLSLELPLPYGVSIGFANPTYKLNFKRQIVELGAVKGATNSPGYDS